MLSRAVPCRLVPCSLSDLDLEFRPPVWVPFLTTLQNPITNHSWCVSRAHAPICLEVQVFVE